MIKYFLPFSTSRASGSYQEQDREIGVFRHVAPTMRLLFEFPHETGLIRRFAGERREPLADKTWESTLLSRSGGVKGLTGPGAKKLLKMEISVTA